MKPSRLILSLTISTSLFAEEMPVMRKYKESETGLAYTFSQVYISGMSTSAFQDNPVFLITNGQNSRQQDKYFNFNKAWEFNYNYVQTLDSNDLKVFADLNYVHADSYTSAPLDTDNNVNIVNKGIILINFSENLTPVTDISDSVCNFKTHIDISSIQTGVSKRFYRTKNIDFSTFGGLDLAYITWENKLNVIADGIYTFQSNSDSLSPFSTSGRSRFYGTGPLIGADVKVPFNKDFLRVNLMAEVSGLMGYRTIYSNSTSNPENNRSYQNRHQFVFVPTLRAEISLDVVIKNFMMTGGIHQQVYFQALTEIVGGGEIVHGGPFLKASYLF